MFSEAEQGHIFGYTWDGMYNLSVFIPSDNMDMTKASQCRIHDNQVVALSD